MNLILQIVRPWGEEGLPGALGGEAPYEAGTRSCLSDPLVEAEVWQIKHARGEVLCEARTRKLSLETLVEAEVWQIKHAQGEVLYEARIRKLSTETLVEAEQVIRRSKARPVRGGRHARGEVSHEAKTRSFLTDPPEEAELHQSNRGQRGVPGMLGGRCHTRPRPGALHKYRR